MDKEQVINIVSNKIKLLRVEKGYTQDKMADILGISKKTLVQIEKGRNSASWAMVVATCAMFKESEVLQSALGDDPLDIITIIAHERIDSPKEKTLGGNVWWTEILKEGRFQLQQNVISKHYRILDEDGYRWYSSFDKDKTLARLNELKN
ncbi:helix-turn-helix domain-containing protein [Bacillota bacterium LX-D]|nr:helix-turn-helix domain-containing protein [Bacillota bacterium LX-D]